jgi:protein SCO1
MPRTAFPLVMRALTMAAMLLICGGGSGIGAEKAGDSAEPLRLIDQTGRAVTASDFKGKPSVVVFGFTSCPSICPTMLNEIAGRMADLGPLADRMNFIFISVDPEQDTPQVLNDYVGYFDKRIIGLTGKEEEIRAVAKFAGAHFQKVPYGEGRYTVDHSTMAFLMDRDWRRVGVLALDPGTDQKRALAKLRAMLGEGEH